MIRRAIVGTLVFVLATTPASAQFAVIDPANLAQAIPKRVVDRIAAFLGT